MAESELRITRRQVLGISLVGGLGLFGLGSLAGCSPITPETPSEVFPQLNETGTRQLITALERYKSALSVDPPITRERAQLLSEAVAPYLAKLGVTDHVPRLLELAFTPLQTVGVEVTYPTTIGEEPTLNLNERFIAETDHPYGPDDFLKNLVYGSVLSKMRGDRPDNNHTAKSAHVITTEVLAAIARSQDQELAPLASRSFAEQLQGMAVSYLVFLNTQFPNNWMPWRQTELVDFIRDTINRDEAAKISTVLSYFIGNINIHKRRKYIEELGQHRVDPYSVLSTRLPRGYVRVGKEHDQILLPPSQKPTSSFRLENTRALLEAIAQ